MTEEAVPPRMHFPSLEPLARPVREWLTTNIGPVDDDGTHKYLIATGSGGVEVRAVIEETHIRWSLGLDGRYSPAGTTPHGFDPDRWPTPVLLAARYVELSADDF